MKPTIRNLLLVISLAFPGVFYASAENSFNVISPDGKVQIRVFCGSDRQLEYEVLFNGNHVIEPSGMGLTIENVDIGDDVMLGESKRYALNENYPWRGNHAIAVNHCTGARIPVMHEESNIQYTLDVRAYDNGVAFCYIVPGEGSRIVSHESTSFRIPEGCAIWHHDFHMHYEGRHTRDDISDLEQGTWVAPPATFRLPGNRGYAAITEGGLYNFSGMGLQADGNRGLSVVLGHEQPVSYPYELRYTQEDINRLSRPAAIEGIIQTPWRVVMIGADLNAMVNNDILHNLSPPPDKKYFPKGFDEEWLKPGRAIWGYLTDEPRTLEGMKNLSKLAGELGFEYHIVEGHWRRWTLEEQKEFVDYSKEQGVRILLWQHSRDLRDPDDRHDFFELCHKIGAAGAKIDFFDHEAKEVIDLYFACLEEAAAYKLVLDFHGANKPTGESRTWPNELTREAIAGFEGRGPWAQHNVTLPFTRMLAGHADYTPMHFGDRRCETTEAHQIASAIVLQAPLLVYAEHPARILNHPAADVIKRIPSVWDETIVLPVSEIGEISAFAKRRGDTWFISVMNGFDARIISIDLSFLKEGDYDATFVRDKKVESAMVSIIRKRETFGPGSGVIIDHTTLDEREGLVIELLPAGGFVGMLTKTSAEQ